jgi:DNA-binding FadR family transcriptional regulator
VVPASLKVLTTLGIVESRAGSGTYVKSVQATDALAAGNWSETQSDFGMLDLLEVRKIIEPRAAWLASTRASERQLADIESARQRLEMHDRDWKLLARLDMEFHAAIFRGAQNAALEAVQRFIMGRLLASQTATVHFAPAVDRMRSDHRLIVGAILRRQADAAEKAMSDHLNAASQDFITGMQTTR